MDNKQHKYVCVKCNFKCNIKAKWETHINTELHKTGIRKKRSDYKEPINCEHCNYKTKNKTTLLKHKLTQHSTKEEREQKFKYYCTLCDYGTFSLDSFEIHKNTKKHKNIELINKQNF